MSMLRPEWAQGLYLALRQHYLTTHTEEDLDDWERHANETTRAIPITTNLNGDYVTCVC